MFLNEQRHVLEDSLRRLMNSPEAAQSTLCSRLESLDPHILPVLSQLTGGNPGTAVLTLIQDLIIRLPKVDEFQVSLISLGRKCAEAGVTTLHYETIGSALLSTLRTVLADRFTHEVEDAWLDFYAEISSKLESASPTEQ